jgi:DMSO/TMAO reductase YedYZ molybdopterin-dependent catalytic subunit
MPPRQPPFISDKTLSRRSLLEWLGSASVLALGSPLLGCASTPGAPHDNGPRDRVAPRGDALTDSVAFGFAPGPALAPPLDRWGERTVDAQDLASIVRTWQLTVDGMVGSRRVLTFQELTALPRQTQVTDFHCVEGWSVEDVPWGGVALSTLLDLVTPTPQATHVTIHTVGGRYNDSLPLAVAREPRTLLAYGIAGSTLPLKHGFPARVVVPRLLGYKNAKFVERLELTDHPVNGYWVAAGYPYAGEVPEGRLRPGKY